MLRAKKLTEVKNQNKTYFCVLEFGECTLGIDGFDELDCADLSNATAR